MLKLGINDLEQTMPSMKLTAFESHIFQILQFLKLLIKYYGRLFLDKIGAELLGIGHANHF